MYELSQLAACLCHSKTVGGRVPLVDSTRSESYSHQHSVQEASVALSEDLVTTAAQQPTCKLVSLP